MGYKLKYKDVYIYGTVTQQFLGKDVINEVETPYTEDDTNVSISLRRNVVRGYGRRNWQRTLLENERGNVILLKKGHYSSLIGIQKKPDETILVFITNVLTDTQREIAEDIVRSLKFNNVNVQVSDNDKLRVKLENRFHEGDRIQREAGIEYGRTDDTDYTTDDE